MSLARRRISTALRPHVTVHPAPDMTIDWNVPVRVRDGTTLRLNVHRPLQSGPDARVPVIASAHPYDKDVIPRRSRSGRAPNGQYRMFPQPHPIRMSDLTGWEAPDPAFWVPHGYAVANIDLRGGGRSEGVDDLLSQQEAEDYHDVIEWLGAQPWSTGKVGLAGVSYLAISQYRVATTHPPSLAAICPWEGLSDIYRDFTRPGGIRENGFSIVWGTLTSKAARVSTKLVHETRARRRLDDWYRSKTPDLAQIDVPMLVCGSFSDHNLHTRGSFEAFRLAGTDRKWLYTHRGGKWSTFYGEDALAAQKDFFDHTLKGADNGWADRPPVRLAIHEAGPDPAEVRMVGGWPPPDLGWRTLHLDARGALVPAAGAPGTVEFGARGGAAWTWTVPEDCDVIGPAALTLHAEIVGAEDFLLFATLRKFRGGREVHFEGSFGYAGAAVTHGWQRLAHRELDERLSAPAWPVHRHDRAEPFAPGEIVPVQVALLPHATRFRAGDEMRLQLTGRWPVRRDPLRGGFPAGYEGSRRGRLRVHTGPGRPSALLIGAAAR